MTLTTNHKPQRKERKHKVASGRQTPDSWQFVFIVASLLFYGTVAVVAVKGFGDVVAMIKRILSQR